MFRNIVPFTETLRGAGAFKEEALRTFVEFIERTLKAEFVRPARTSPGADRGVADLFAMAHRFREAGIGTGLFEVEPFPDEPRIRTWFVDEDSGSSGGLASESDRPAMTAALAEALERHIWYHETDYFSNPAVACPPDVPNAISLERFAGFRDAALEDAWLWVDAYSWATRTAIRIPAQLVSWKHVREHGESERRIHPAITTGLATGVTQTDAVLGGMLEYIERDAYMTMWFNQLTLPRIDHASFNSESLRALLKRCATYAVDVHFVRLITDAPTYVIAAITRDAKSMPAFSLGTCADANPDRAAEKALLEALRARANTRRQLGKNPDVARKSRENIAGSERYGYWNTGERWKLLDFMSAGNIQPLAKEAWDRESNEDHLERILTWCRTNDIECVSVPLTKSQKNISDWHIEFAVLPELQPLFLNEKSRIIDDERRRAIAELHGYTPRPEAYIAEPHPFV